MTSETSNSSKSEHPTFSDYLVPLMVVGIWAYILWDSEFFGLFRSPQISESPQRPLSEEEVTQFDTLAALAETADPRVGEVWLCGSTPFCADKRLYQTDAEDRAAYACPLLLAVPGETGPGIVAFGAQRIETAFQLVGMGRHWIWSEDAGSAVNPDLRMANMASLRVIGEGAASTVGRYHNTFYSVDENVPVQLGFVEFLDLRETRDLWSREGNPLYCRRSASNEEVDALLGLSDL